jgi:transposase
LTTQETVSKWIDGWEKYQFDSLIDKPRPGRTPLIPGEEYAEIIDIVKKNPRQLKTAIIEIEEKFGKKISIKTLKRIIKKNCVGVADGNLSKANAMRMSSGKRKRKLKS